MIGGGMTAGDGGAIPDSGMMIGVVMIVMGMNVPVMTTFVVTVSLTGVVPAAKTGVRTCVIKLTGTLTLSGSVTGQYTSVMLCV